jgi:alkaline phosphatase
MEPQRRRTIVWLLFTVVLLAGCAAAGPTAPLEYRNVILVIGDGLGFEQLRAASYYEAGRAEALAFHELPYRGHMSTAAADSAITDSAAAATAIATGVRVANGTISVRLPGDGAPLETVLEWYAARGKATGLVTTTYATHATPAAFAAHQESRANTHAIATDYLSGSRPEVIFGGGGHGITPAGAEQSGYMVVRNGRELAELRTDALQRVSGQFGIGHMPYELDGLGDLPHLSQMTAAAVELLSHEPDGFFLMVEGGRIDHAGHANEIDDTIHEIIELSRTVAWLHEWATARPNTLLLVTSDHETGGLEVLQNRGEGQVPAVRWSTTGHTALEVPVFAAGPGAEAVTRITDNTDLYHILLGEQ